MGTLGVYIQIPFCASKCSFCNFSSRVAPASVLDTYCLALKLEIERLPALYEGEQIGQGLFGVPVDTLYVGGGTPTLIGAHRLEQILDALGKRFQFCAPCEFTLEVTPNSADDDFLRRARALGVDRLSIGAQSFVDRELRSVGRLHSSSETWNWVSGARRAGFANLSFDLIAGLPYQTEASWSNTLRTAMALKPEHISVYLFEVDEKSRLGNEVLRAGSRYHAGAVPGDGFMAAAYEHAQEVLTGEGYVQYEISNFALPGYESRHNQKYWQRQAYLGLGAGAHSFVGDHRWANLTEAESYAEKLARGESPMAEIHRLSPDEQLEEFFFLGLRQRDGIDLAIASELWGQARLSRWEGRISALLEAGWLERLADRVRLSERAYLVSNEIFQEFLAV